MTQMKIALHQGSQGKAGKAEEREREVGRREDPSRGYGLGKVAKGKKDVWGGGDAGGGGPKKGGAAEEGAATRFLFE